MTDIALAITTFAQAIVTDGRLCNAEVMFAKNMNPIVFLIMSTAVYDNRISFHDGVICASFARVACWIRTIRDE
jgi:hypothetical protein